MLTDQRSEFILHETFVKDDRVPIEKGYLTISEFAELAMVSHQTAWNYVRRGIFKNAHKMPGGPTSPWRIPLQDALPYIPADSLPNSLKKRVRSGRKT